MKKTVIIVFVLFILLPTSISVSASSYMYNSYGKATPSPDVYSVKRIITGKDIGCGSLYEPTDMFVDNNIIYILDSKNGRVVVTDQNFNLLNIVDKFIYNGEESFLKSPRGLFVVKDKIYIADTDNNRIVVTDINGVISKVFLKPKSSFFDQKKDFLPSKLVLDSAGNLYVISIGIYQGVIIFDNEGAFQGFFGSDSVIKTSEAISDFFWKQIMTKEQREQLSRQVPPELRAIDINRDDFIFSITNSNLLTWASYKNEMDKIRKLNPKGKDILINQMTKTALRALENDAKYLNFVDICHSDNGLINVVDNNKGRIMQFSPNMNLITAFGNLGDYKGSFSNPAAIESINDSIIVLDGSKNNITVFDLTEFGNKIHSAIKAYYNGSYEDAIEPWREVIKLNTNYEDSYNGIANALMNEQKFSEAMKYFKLARNSDGYNEAFKQFRIEFIRKNFAWFVISFVLIVILILILKKRNKGG